MRVAIAGATGVLGRAGIDRQFAATNRLRTEGTRNLVDAVREAGSRRLVAQSISFAVEPGGGLADERTPLWTEPPMAGIAEAIATSSRAADGPCRDRTYDLEIKSLLLYQLS